MIAELDCVALNVNLPEHGLAVDDVGAVVHVLNNGGAYMVEFTTYEGNTVALVKLSAEQIRRLSPNEIHHARSVEMAAH
jgi:Domain of unknown function (DUF4926)